MTDPTVTVTPAPTPEPPPSDPFKGITDRLHSAAVPPQPKRTWRERWEDPLTRHKCLCIFVASIGSICVLVTIIFTALHYMGDVNMLAGPVPPSVEQGQPQAPPASTAVPTKPTAPATPYQRKQVIVTEGTFLWSVWVWRSTPWQAAGDPWCFQIDLNAWSKVTLDDVPVLVDCTKSTRSNVTGQQRYGRNCLDVSDCMVAYYSD